MQIEDKKAFLDSVHGYIYVDSDYCQKFIDTPIFQRLRRIEQVSFRAICPSARHDRFIHSLGVYYMGEKMLGDMKSNIHSTNIDLYNDIDNEFNIPSKSVSSPNGWKTIQKNFEIACLLHDCGHAPFSHTFEEYYAEDKSQIIESILEEFNVVHILRPTQDRKRDLPDRFKKEIEVRSPKVNYHELCGAWLVLHEKGFRKIILDEGGDPILIARMITGCVHLKKSDFPGSELQKLFPAKLTDREQLENCFISLLNGHAIDADRLDYFARDRWATGLNTSRVDLDRLLFSISIGKNRKKKNNPKQEEEEAEYVICINKRALSELKNITDVKDFLNFWIIKHHKVYYDKMMLVKAVKELAILLVYGDKSNPLEGKTEKEKGQIENRALYSFFNYKNFLETAPFSFCYKGKKYQERLRMTTDDDIVYLLKKYFCAEIPAINHAQEWMYRQHQLVPVWKTYADFKDLFGDITNPDITKLRESAKKICSEFLKEKTANNTYATHTQQVEITAEIKSTLCSIDTNDEPVFIKVEDVLKRYNELAAIINPQDNKDSSLYSCSHGGCDCTDKLCEKLKYKYQGNSTWNYFYIYMPRLFEANTKDTTAKEVEVDKLTYSDIYHKELIGRIIEEYRNSTKPVSPVICEN